MVTFPVVVMVMGVQRGWTMNPERGTEPLKIIEGRVWSRPEAMSFVSAMSVLSLSWLL